MIEKKPSVSVIIPAYNEENFIGGLLESLNRQDYPSNLIEIIVVDNNSTDATKSIAEKMGATVLTEKNGPVGNVRNRGVLESKTDIIFFIDSDCIAPTEWISTGVSYLMNAGKGNIIGGGYLLRDNPHFIERYWLLENTERRTKPQELLGGAIGMYKSDFIEAGMFDTSVTSGEDTKLNDSLVGNNCNVSLDSNFSVIHLGNPVKPSVFIKRQIWHSENYIPDIGNSVKDPVFWVTLAFLISLILSLFSIVYSDLIIFIVVPIAAASLLSVKRILRSRCFKFFFLLPFVISVDILYLIGRSIGLLKGLLRKPEFS